MCCVRYFKDSDNNNCSSLPFPANRYMLKVSNRNLRNIKEDYPKEREILTNVFFRELCKIFKNTFFTEHFRVTAADIRMQVVVIYNLNLPLQFAPISGWSILQCRLNICIIFFFSVGLFLIMLLLDSF